jgi:hypothetical protein
MKQKKVTFKLFLNKNLTPQNEKYYPVYFRITYNRQNTKIPDVLVNDHTLYWSEEDLDAFERGFYSDKTREVADMVKESMQFYEDIIRYEAKKGGEEYSVIGLAERARFYRQSFRKSFEEQLSYLVKMEAHVLQQGDKVAGKGGIGKLLQGIEEHKTKLSSSFTRMQELAILIDLYSMPQYNLKYTDSFFADTIYYWEMKTGMAEFEEFINRYFGSKAEIDEHYLEERFKHDTPERRHLQLLYNHFPPQSDHKTLYINIVSTHLQSILAKRE